MSAPDRKKPLRYAAIIGSLAALAIILSPISPFAQPKDPLTNSAGTIVEPPQPEETSDEDVLACTSLIEGVEYAIAGGRLQGVGDEDVFPGEGEELERPTFNLTSEEKLAADTLLGEFCNRPELVQEMSGSYDPTVSLVAYGCDAASGKIGDEAMQDSIADYREIYCSSAVETIEYESLLWSSSLEAFSTDVLPAAREQHSDEATVALMDEAEIILGNSTASLANAQELLAADSVYEAAKALDKGITLFTAMIEREDMAFLLEFESG